MSASRNGYIGRAPADSSVLIARKTYEPTGVQTDFTFAAGYTPGYCDVYLNGVKLIDATDYSATNGSTVGLTSAAASGDVVEVVAYKAFNLGVPLSNITGNLDITGNISASSSITVDSGFYGDGSNLSGVAGAAITQYISANSLAVLGSPGVSTITRLGATDLNVTGIITANGLSGNVTGAACTFTTGTFNGNVTIGGTLTYEDVTNVDALGIITARAGVNVSGGEFKVGTALTIGSAGVVTATSYYGDGSNLSGITGTTINSNADNRLITGSGTANTLNGETNLTFDGASFKVGSGITMAATSGVVTFANGSATANNITLGNGKLRLYHNGGSSGYIVMDTGTSGNLYIRGTSGSDMIQISNNYTALGPGQKLMVLAGGVEAQNGYFKAGVSTITSLTVNGTSGLTASGGEFKVGTALTVASTSGVATFSGTSDVHLLDNVKLLVGDGSDLSIYHDSSDSYISQTGSGNIIIQGNGTNNIAIRAKSGEEGINLIPDGSVDIYYNNSKKFETTNDGTVTTGIATATYITSTNTVKVTSSNLSNVAFSVGDVNTGWYNTGTDAIGLSINGGQALNINSSRDILINGSAAGVSSVTWDASANSLIFNDNSKLKFGDAPDLDIWHDGSASYVQNATGELHLRSNTLKLADYNSSHVYFRGLSGDTSELYFDNSKKFETTNDGVLITGIATVSQGLNTDGLLSEKFHTTAGKLSDNTNIDLENGMVHYFTTQETTTSTPNIRYNSSKTLNNMLSTGDSITVTIITTAAAGGYSANMNIDGNGQTEEWVGGSAPSAGGSDGLDIYSYTILKTSNSPAYKVIANVLSATN